MRKLTQMNVRIIRRLYNHGWSQAKLARQYKVVPNTIFDIVHWNTWKWVR